MEKPKIDLKFEKIDLALDKLIIQPKIHISTATPTSSDGENNDIWIQY